MYQTNTVTEQSCDWLHLFGGHGFDLLSTGRAKYTWVPHESQCPEKAIMKTLCHEAPGQSADWQTLQHSTVAIKLHGILLLCITEI